MRLALWTAQPAGWPAALAKQCSPEAVIVPWSMAVRADLHVYHVAAGAAGAFVYQALLHEPGLVVLEDWNLHDLVYATTAGRGESTLYRREMRRAHGPTGSFVARQVLRGLGGVLTSLTPLNTRVLEASLGVVATSEAVGALARQSVRDRPVAVLPAGDPSQAASLLLALAREVEPRLAAARRALAVTRGEEATPLGRALEEILPLARELGLNEVRGVRPLLASLFPPG